MSQSVVIVGGGLAGLCAAYELAKNGINDIEIIEASNRLGGRVRSIQIEEKEADVGGFMIHKWYKYLLRIIKELDLEKDLTHLPKDTKILFQAHLKEDPKEFRELHIPIFQKLKLGLFYLIHILFRKKRKNYSHPDLDVYQQKTVEDFLKSLTGKDKDLNHYLDMLLQGFCCPPTKEAKTSFFAPIAYITPMDGDFSGSLYFKEGTETLTRALEKYLQKKGVKITKNTRVIHWKENEITLENKTKRTADHIIFASTLDRKLHSQLLPFKVTEQYTEYHTVAIRLKSPLALHNGKWGGLFLIPKKKEKYQLISLVNAHRLNGLKSPCEVVLNIVARERNGKKLSKKEILEIFDAAKKTMPCLKGNQIEKIHGIIHWKKSIPIANEEWIKGIRKQQGKNGIYFAGDYLGAPCMETAAATGVQAAQLVLKERSL